MDSVRPTQTTRSLALIVFILCGLVMRIGLVLYLPGTYDGDPYRQDDHLYDSLASHILQGYGYAVNRTSTLSFAQCPPCEQIYYPTPGYALFLAAIYGIFGQQYLIVRLLQAIIDIVTACLAYRLAKDLTKDTSLAFVTMLLALFCLVTAVWVTSLQTDSLATCLATATVWSAVRVSKSNRRTAWMWFGFIASLGILIRPGFLFLPVVLLVAVWLRTREFSRGWLYRSIQVLSLVTVVLSPWLIRNYLLTGQLMFVTKNVSPEQDHVWGYFAWGETWMRDATWTPRWNWDYVIYAPDAISDQPFPDFAYDSALERNVVEGLMRQVKLERHFTQEIDDQFKILADKKAAQNVVRQYVLLPILRESRAWISSGTSGFNVPSLKQDFSFEGVQREPLTFAMRLILIVMQSGTAVLGFAGMGLLAKRFWDGLPLVVSVLYHTAVIEVAAFGVQPRFLVYAFPVMCVFVAISIVAFIRLLSRISMRSRNRFIRQAPIRS